MNTPPVSNPELCHCRKDRIGHELVPYPLYVKTKQGLRLITQCPARKDTPPIPIRYEQDGTQVPVLRAIARPVIYPTPRYLWQRINPKKEA